MNENLWSFIITFVYNKGMKNSDFKGLESNIIIYVHNKLYLNRHF